jgi:hypothetical protein
MKIKSVVIAVTLAIAVIGLGFSVKAQTTDQSALIAQLQAQIQVLMQQIAALTQQQGGQAWCHTFNKNLKIGDSGNEIESIIKILSKEGVFNPDNVVAKYSFDENIASAVVGLQEKYASEILTPSGLKHGTGYVGPATRKKLNALYGCKIEPKYCTQEVKQCPDGSYVGRTGPNCEFAQCPKTQCTIDSDCPQPTCAANTIGSTPSCVGVPIKCVDGKCVAKTQPSITVTSPNGGEILIADSMYDIKWTYSGIDPNSPVSIILIDDAQNKTYEIESGFGKIGDGKVSWFHVPVGTFYNGLASLFTGKKFKIKVSVATKDALTGYSDSSDNYFAIATAITQNNSILTAQRLFPGQYDNTKYLVTIRDPDGLGDIVVNKAGGGILMTGSPRSGITPCAPSTNSGTVTLSLSDFPLTGSVVDCKSSTVYPVSVQMPAFPLSVTLNYVKIVDNNLKISYSKNFDTCVHLLDASNKMLHIQNWFFQKGDNIEVSTPLSDFSVTNNQQIKICHGNDYRVCSNYITVATPCKYATLLDDNNDGIVTRSEGEEVIRRVQNIIGSRLGDPNFVAAYDTKDDGVISPLDSLRLINDLNICVPAL